ncbi:orotate phosphoribosyltransferase [Convivina intestini]|uniref:orotate phosphoribosyltransferase n=1 Tax=Convivina intestini TaxID=1505726 RepID=UPI00200C0555|nr:orotate phosphoribosyltransferase [Convivina intestini]CAH1853010.1 Orotate phosphoribosyltransferase [Convivina intestini]
MTDIKAQVAQDLLDIGAVKFSPQKPFTWASGIQSPIYTDNRLTIGFPTIRQRIARGLAELITEKFNQVDIIGGVATAGIPHAAWVADLLEKPMVYVRSKPKDHGAGRQSEGAAIEGKRLVLIDDLISTGGSVLAAAKTINASGGQVVGVVSIFSYELPASQVNFDAAQIPFYPLTTFSELMAMAQQSGQLSESDLASLAQWRQNPQAWQ